MPANHHQPNKGCWPPKIGSLSGAPATRYSSLAQLRLNELDEPDGPHAEGIRRDLGALAALRNYALPLVEELAALPASALWGEWLDVLTALATRALRHPEHVLSSR